MSSKETLTQVTILIVDIQYISILYVHEKRAPIMNLPNIKWPYDINYLRSLWHHVSFPMLGVMQWVIRSMSRHCFSSTIYPVLLILCIVGQAWMEGKPFSWEPLRKSATPAQIWLILHFFSPLVIKSWELSTIFRAANNCERTQTILLETCWRSEGLTLGLNEIVEYHCSNISHHYCY